MGALKQSIANKDQVKSESKYLNEDPTIKLTMTMQFNVPKILLTQLMTLN